MSLFESVSILVKGGWKETRGFQRPISAEEPVSESRMASLNPFETKRKKAPLGTSSRVCDVQVAEAQGAQPSLCLRVFSTILFINDRMLPYMCSTMIQSIPAVSTAQSVSRVYP